MKEENKIPLLAVAILIVFLIIATACAKQDKAPLKIGVPKNLLNEVFILPTTETFPEEKNVLLAVPIIPIEIIPIE